MEYKDKEILFNRFLSKWGESFGKIPFVLKYIDSYPQLTAKLDDFQSLDIEELKNSQLEWLSVLAQLDNPIESTYFKEYWVPIQKNGYDYFIDLSSDSLPLFEAHYFCMEPYRWYTNFIIDDMSNFLLEIDKPSFDIAQHFEEVNDLQWAEYWKIGEERDKLGFEGKIKNEPLDKESLMSTELIPIYSLDGNCLKFNGVNSVIIGLLPMDCNVTLLEFEATYNKNDQVCSKVKNIHTMVYLLHSVGYISIDFYSLKFGSDLKGTAFFNDNSIVIMHGQEEVLRSFADKYEAIMNS